MAVIDADTHIDETEDTWEFIQAGEEALKPRAGSPANPDPNRPPTRYWLVDGRRQQRFTRSDERTKTTVQMRELLDVSERLRRMDELGIDVQVIYPTMFLVEGTDRPEVDMAIRRSYNRWLADRSAKAGGRLRWVCLPPYRNVDKAIEELRFAKEHGACGILKKGNQEADHWVADEYFHPIYEEAEKLDLPICIHTGSGVPDYSPTREFLHSAYLRMTSPVPNAFEAVVTFGVAAKFSKLRFGFIEAGASWVPFLMYHLRRRVERIGDSTFGRLAYDASGDMMKNHRLYVTCQVDEDLPYLLKFTGEDNLLVGSDFTHSDSAMELTFTHKLRERAERGEFSESVVRKITEDNPKAFYGI